MAVSLDTIIIIVPRSLYFRKLRTKLEKPTTNVGDNISHNNITIEIYNIEDKIALNTQFIILLGLL